MAIEAELKAVVRDAEGVVARLEEAYGPGRGERVPGHADGQE
jgi:hypothetical protein